MIAATRRPNDRIQPPEGCRTLNGAGNPAITGIIAARTRQNGTEFLPPSCPRRKLSPIIRDGQSCGKRHTARSRAGVLPEAFMDQRIRLATAAAVMLIGLGFAVVPPSGRDRRSRSPAKRSPGAPPTTGPARPCRGRFAVGRRTGTSTSDGAGRAFPANANDRHGDRSPRAAAGTTEDLSRFPRLQRTCQHQFRQGRSDGKHAVGGVAWGDASRSRGCSDLDAADAQDYRWRFAGLAGRARSGSASRAMEIFQANRNVLTEPTSYPWESS